MPGTPHLSRSDLESGNSPMTFRLLSFIVLIRLFRQCNVFTLKPRFKSSSLFIQILFDDLKKETIRTDRQQYGDKDLT